MSAAASDQATVAEASTVATSATATAIGTSECNSNKRVVNTFQCSIGDCKWSCCAKSSLNRHYRENHIEAYKDMIHSNKVRPSKKTLLALNLSTSDTEPSKEGKFECF